MPMTTDKPRILLYSHDTYGLGHLRRSLAIAGQIAQDLPQAHQLLVTGSMVAGAFDLPPQLDMIKLPALSKRSSGQYKARALPLTLKQTLAWREEMILQAVVNFAPNLVLVDKVAAGAQGELLPTLRHLKTWLPKTHLVLGMRDIEDSPEATCTEWEENETRRLHDEVYDCLLYYGERAVFDPIAAYDMSPWAAAKLVECGYLRRDLAPRSPEEIRRELGIGECLLIVVTVGGGGDGYDIVKTYLDLLVAIPGDSPYHSLIVTGPLMAQNKHAALARLAQRPDVTLLEFTADLGSYLNAADLVVSMAGYNTTCEILSLGKRAILIPRGHTRAEQRIRATSLAERELAHLLLPEELTPGRLETVISTALAAPPPDVSLNLDGLTNAGRAIHAQLAGFQPTGWMALEPWPQLIYAEVRR
jgi:predicted glycosyltransferase